MDASPRGADSDRQWNTVITIRLVPDHRLSAEQRSVVARDYGMTRNTLSVTTRGALVQYALQALRVDTSIVQLKPEAQQIVVANLEDLQDYLF